MVTPKNLRLDRQKQSGSASLQISGAAGSGSTSDTAWISERSLAHRSPGPDGDRRSLRAYRERAGDRLGYALTRGSRGVREYVSSVFVQCHGAISVSASLRSLRASRMISRSRSWDLQYRSPLRRDVSLLDWDSGALGHPSLRLLSSLQCGGLRSFEPPLVSSDHHLELM